MKGLFGAILLFAGLGDGDQSPVSLSSDTVNRKDETGLKQGWWVFQNNGKLPCADSVMYEEGKFVNNKKEGVWKRYYCNGNVKSRINYVNNRPWGKYTIYFEDGKVEEEGNWVNNHNVDKFNRFYENGNMSQNFDFNASGKREGIQKYYYENGQLMIEGNWEGGKESGVLKEYYPSGELKAEKYFSGGSIDHAKTKFFMPKKASDTIQAENPEDKQLIVVRVGVDESPNIDRFDGEGYHKLYNQNRLLSKDGVFKNYKLVDGKEYIYDDNGILQKIRRIKNGYYVGDVPIEEEK